MKQLNNMKFIGIIPARYASTRFPGKPLALLNGKPIIQHVYERVSKSLEKVVVATDDERIMQCVSSFGGLSVMTNPNHKSGTDRCDEAYRKITEKFDVVINIQGDEPFITNQQLSAIKNCFEAEDTQIATLVHPFGKVSYEVLSNPNSPKVVFDHYMNALYFSRSVIPYIRSEEFENWAQNHSFYKHIGLYAYRAEVLDEITKLPQSILEKAESLEQLRWLENGYKIKVAIATEETIGIDTPEDLLKAEKYIQSIGKTETFK